MLLRTAYIAGLAAAFAAALSACASTTSADGIPGVVRGSEVCNDPDGCQVDLSPDPAVTENFRRQYHSNLLGNFGEFEIDLPSASAGADFSKQIRIVIDPSFRPPLLVAAAWHKYKHEGDPPSDPVAYFYAKTFGPGESGPEAYDDGYALISFSGYAVPRELGVVVWQKDLRESYSTRVSLDDFKSVYDEMLSEKVFGMPFVRLADGLCTDGTTYFVDISNAGKKSVYTRHSCDPGFSEDFEIVAPIMEVAGEKFPELRELVTSYASGVLTDQIDR
ncbi:hypothetical protein [Hyphococcus sp.]|uniref:hypothetical protein n=1 Tax=Hyphococcus sp. TaxID=2038636 RepID=UPI003CCBB562